MMAASSDFLGASSRRSDGSQSNHESIQSIHNAVDDEFGSFAAAERLSDPFGDVYGAEADFGDFVGGSGDQGEPLGPSVAMENSSLMFFSPLMAPAAATAPSTLLLTIRGELDPFADITDGLEDTVGTGEEEEKPKDITGAFQEDLTSRRVAAAPTSTSSATSAILDLVWGHTSQERDGNALSMSATSVGNGRTRTAFNPSGVVGQTPETSADLLSFSPFQDSTPIDPFFGIDYTAAPVFENDELFTVTATPPLSTTSSSAPTSLRGSYVSLHDNVRTPGLSSFTPGSVEAKASPRDPFAEPTTRSFRSLSSSFVSAGAINDIADRDGRHASFSTFSRDTLKATSPLSAPPSLRSSLKLASGFQGFAPVADESDEADPFAEALAAWSTDPDHVMDEELRRDCVEKRTDEVNAEVAADASKDDVGTASVVEGKNEVSNISDLTKPAEDVDSLDAWMIATEPNEAFDDPFITEHPTGDVLHSPATAVDSDVEDDENTVNLISNDNDNEVHVFGLQGNASDSDISDIDKSDAGITANKKTGLPVEQSSVDADHFDKSRSDTLSSTMDSNVDSASQALYTRALEDQCSSLHQDTFYTLSTSPPSVATGLRVASDEPEENVVVETTKQKGLTAATEANGSDNFGDFGGFGAAPATPVMKKSTPDASPWAVPKMPIENVDAADAFEVLETTSTFADTAPVDDGFGNFAQSTEPRGDDEFGDFGDFGDFEPDFQQSRVDTFGESDDGFGDFTPAVAPALVTAPTSLVPSLSKNELSAFFKEAFPMKPLPAILPYQPKSLMDVESTDSFQVKLTDFIHNLFREMWNEYIIGTATSSESSSLSDSLSTSALDTKRASKYLKYVLTEKIQEASKQNGIFTHGSERHQMYEGYTASGDADRMCAALKELQDALFHKSVNDAMMRIAKQAALSAKAKIAEQAAQQQANSRGGSLFSTTRHLLSRGGNSLGAHGPSSSGSDGKSDHVGADTPTGVSVQKLARFSLTNNHDDSATAHRGAHNGEERVSDASDHTGHSSGSDTEAASSADSRTRSQISNSGSSNGGLMKKFQNRFSFASSRHRPRFVSLRRKGQSGEEVRKMELNLDAISGGLDEVKWKCALFLYDVEEVTHVAPSQISILAYPSKQPLTGKTDRSALTKLVKSDTIWTVDIGANKSNMLNEW